MDHRIHIDAFPRLSAVRPKDAIALALATAGGTIWCIALQDPRALAWSMAALAATAVFLSYPELALAAYIVVGDIKGNEAVASLVPVDLTLAVGAVLILGIAVNLLRGRRPLSFPGIYFLLVPFVTMMAASLIYTPSFDAGADKFARFVTLTGIAIVAPFFVLTTRSALRRFLVGFGALTFAICFWSLSKLGTGQRLVSPSDNTIGLGHVACAAFVLVWVGLIMRYSFPKRALAYPLLAIPAIALVGSGSRGSAIACALVIAITVAWNRRLLLDLLCLTCAGAAALPLIGIPGASISYLSTVFESHSVGELLNFRADLLKYGWQLLQQHPFLGAGLGGFRYSSPNPTLYKWPHDIFLGIACEMGIPAAILILVLFGSALREAIRGVRDRFCSCPAIARITAAFLLVGIVNAANTGNINSDRMTWFFVSLVFAERFLHRNEAHQQHAEKIRSLQFAHT